MTIQHINDRISKSKAVSSNIKSSGMFNYGLQSLLARLLICYLLRPGLTFGVTFCKFKGNEIEKLNIFQIQR